MTASGVYGFAVYANGDLGLDAVDSNDEQRRGAIDVRYGLGWGIYPPTRAGMLRAIADAEEWTASAREMMPDGIGGGDEQVAPAEVLAIGEAGDRLGAPVAPCSDCGEPVFYDERTGADCWRAVDIDHACFLVAGCGSIAAANWTREP